MERYLPVGVKLECVRARRESDGRYVSLNVRPETRVAMARTLGQDWWHFDHKTELYVRQKGETDD